MNRYLIFILLMCVGFVQCTKHQKEEKKASSTLVVEAVKDKDWQLVWSDEFDQDGLPDATKWSFDVGDGCPHACGWGNNELQYYTEKRLENARVENGNLIIEAKKEEYEDAQYTSARLVTKNKGDWKYGKVEVKAKLAGGTGTWSAIWMLPTMNEYGGWPNSGEIDIMEHVGYEAEAVHGTVHTGAYNHMKGSQKGGKVTDDDLESDFHVYSIVWTENQIDFYKDDERYFVFTNDQKTSAEWPFDQAFHLILNIAVGGNWGGMKGIDDEIFPQRMEIDYVRVYQ